MYRYVEQSKHCFNEALESLSLVKAFRMQYVSMQSLSLTVCVWLSMLVCSHSH